jgi:hypothetical protein
MAIDDPFDAYETQYLKDEAALPNKLAKYASDFGIKLAFPGGGLAAEIFIKALDNLFDRDLGIERVRELLELLKGQFAHVDRTKANHEDVQKAIQLVIWYDRHERDNAKRERYVKVIGSALKSEEQIRDVASFIQTLERLNERDIIVLKVINKVMNKQGDWNQQNPVIGRGTKLHPSTLIGRAQELANQVGLALGQATERNLYNREEGYTICNRLQGFGLAHELEQTRELTLTNYVFRLSIHGVVLLKLLGEDVPNYEYYMQP